MRSARRIVAAREGEPVQISNNQMQALGANAEQDFERRIAQHLRDRHPGAIAPLTDIALRERITASLARGRARGLTWQSSLVGFVVLMFEIGPEFDEQPAFARALAMRMPDENARIRAIYGGTNDEDWEAARAAVDSRAWARLTQGMR